MPRAPKVKAEDEDVKPCEKNKSPEKKSPSKAGGGAVKGEGPWTPEQAWALFNAIYKKGERALTNDLERLSLTKR
jgi:hypothetical protein